MALLKYVHLDNNSLTRAINLLVDAVNSENVLLTAITASGAIAPHTGGQYVITNAAVTALTIAAPTAGTDDGLRVNIRSTTAYAHTLTATGLLQTGTASVNLATFAAFAGAGLSLTAFNGKWIVSAQEAITFS